MRIIRGLAVLLVIQLLVVTAALGATVEQSESMSVEIDFTSITGVPIRFRSSIEKAMKDNLDILPPVHKFTVSAVRYSDEWLYAVLVPSTVIESGWDSVNLEHTVDVLGHYDKRSGQWITVIFGGKGFMELAQEVPADFKDLSYLFASSLASSLNLLFPWTDGQPWYKTQGWHSSASSLTTYDAMDFQPVRRLDPESDYAVLASEGGQVEIFCKDTADQAWLKIVHPNGQTTYYGHLQLSTIRQDILGTQVQQGQFLGLLFVNGNLGNPYNTGCGIGTAAHLHFVFPERNVSIDGHWADAVSKSTYATQYTSSNQRIDDPDDPNEQPPCDDLPTNNPPSETAGWKQWAPENPSFNLNNCKPLLTGDTNGDGRTDLICVYDYGNDKTITWVQEATSTGFDTWTQWGALHDTTVPNEDPYAGSFNINNCVDILPAHLDSDQQTDLLCVYNYGNDTTRTWAQLSSSGTPDARKWQFWSDAHSPTTPEEAPYAGAFDVTKCTALLTAHLDSDQQTDLLCVYDYGNDTTRTWAQLSSDGTSTTRKWQFWSDAHSPTTPEEAPYAGAFDVTRCATIVTGHLDEDNQPDLACVYDYGNDTTRTWAQLSSDGEPATRKWRFWSDVHEATTPHEGTYAGAFDVKRCGALLSGDVDNDQKTDLICAYDYGNNVTRTWVQLYADGEHGTRRWMFWGPLHSADTTAKAFNVQNCTLLEARDIEGDGDSDLVCSYDYGKSCYGPLDLTRTWFQRSNGAGFEAWTVIGSGEGSPFRLTNCLPLTTGNIDNDARIELVCPYNRGSDTTDTWVQFLVLPAAPVHPYNPANDPYIPTDPTEPSDTPVLILQAPTSVEPGETITVTMIISNVEVLDDVRELIAHVQVSDTATLLPVEQPSPGIFFADGGNTDIALINDGFTISMTLPLEQQAKSGYGSVAYLPFHVVNEGCVMVSFAEHELRNSLKQTVEHTVQSSDLCVTTTRGSIQATVYLESGASPEGIHANLVQGTTVVSMTATDAQGVVRFPNIEDGTYAIHVVHPLFVEAERKDVQVVGANLVDVGEIGLYAGDVNVPQDGLVNQIDWRLMNTALAPVNNPYFDIDANGTTDLDDLSYVEGNRNRSASIMRTTNAPLPTTTALQMISDAVSVKQDGSQHVVVVNNEDTLLVRLENFDGLFYGVGARLTTLPDGIKVTDFTARGAFAQETVFVHQVGTTVYISAVVTGDKPITGDTDVVLLNLSEPADVEVDAETFVSPSEEPSYFVFIPYIIR